MDERNTNDAYLLIGGNMGDRETFLSEARKKIEQSCGTITRESSIYETAAWGYKEQENFLNQALRIKTQLSAEELLQQILKAEEQLGRKRDIKYGPRIIDIDILFFNDDVVNTHGLTIPHPELQNRRFVLVPLNEIAADKVHPVLKKTALELLAECADKLDVYKFN